MVWNRKIELLAANVLYDALLRIFCRKKIEKLNNDRKI
jgi:hypothetical protein